jgi:hypothetical protein
MKIVNKERTQSNQEISFSNVTSYTTCLLSFYMIMGTLEWTGSTYILPACCIHTARTHIRKHRIYQSLVAKIGTVNVTTLSPGEVKIGLLYDETSPVDQRYISAAGEAVRDIAKAALSTPSGAPAVILKLR